MVSSEVPPKVVMTTMLYSSECVALLERAVQTAQEQQQVDDPLEYHRRMMERREASSEDDRSASGDDSSSSSSSLSVASDANDQHDTNDAHVTSKEAQPLPSESHLPSSKHNRPRRITNQKTRESKHRRVVLGTPPATALRINVVLNDDDDDDDSCRPQRLELPTALLSKSDRLSQNDLIIARSYLNLSRSLSSVGIQQHHESNPTVLVVLLRSGRFAGGVFSQSTCLDHGTFQRYTVRRGQGKAQSSQDNSKRKAQSMGAQLRRAGEEQLEKHVQQTLTVEWRGHVRNAALILWSCPKTMRKQLFGEGMLAREDERLRQVPLDFGRPSYEAVRAVYETMMQGRLSDDVLRHDSEYDPDLVDEADAVPSKNSRADNVTKIEEEKTVIPLTPLHQHAAHGDLKALEMVDNVDDYIDQPAGDDMMTPLHYAAESCTTHGVDPLVAADVVLSLLVDFQANPCMVDSRHRVPYFVASHSKVCEAFRRSRATLGEDRWSWDDAAKVGPPLTEEDVDRKKEKAAEKKRRQRARQKEKKARDKAQAEEMAMRANEEEEKRQQEVDARRVRDGLQPKSTAATNVCDFCQKVCKGKRSQMLQRLDYVYCSTECVQKHKRELMASAALARFG